MPPLLLPLLRRRDRAEPAASPSSRPSPAQRVVRVLQVTRANWPVLPGGRRKARREAPDTVDG